MGTYLWGEKVAAQIPPLMAVPQGVAKGKGFGGKRPKGRRLSLLMMQAPCLRKVRRGAAESQEVSDNTKSRRWPETPPAICFSGTNSGWLLSLAFGTLMRTGVSHSATTHRR